MSCYSVQKKHTETGCSTINLMGRCPSSIRVSHVNVIWSKSASLQETLPQPTCTMSCSQGNQSSPSTKRSTENASLYENPCSSSDTVLQMSSLSLPAVCEKRICGVVYHLLLKKTLITQDSSLARKVSPQTDS